MYLSFLKIATTTLDKGGDTLSGIFYIYIYIYNITQLRALLRLGHEISPMNTPKT